MFTHSSLAQSVEHAAVNRRVVCSSQTGGAKKSTRSNDRVLFLVYPVSFRQTPAVTQGDVRDRRRWREEGAKRSGAKGSIRKRTASETTIWQQVVCSSQTGGAKKEDRPKGLSSFLVICARHKQKSLCFGQPHPAVICFAATVAAGGSIHRRCEDRRNRERWRQRRTARPCFKEMGRLFELDRRSKNRRHGAPCLLFFSFLCMIPTDDPVFPLLHPAVNCFAATVAAGGSIHRRCEDRRNRERWRQRRTARPCFKEMGRLFEPDRSSHKTTVDTIFTVVFCIYLKWSVGRWKNSICFLVR